MKKTINFWPYGIVLAFLIFCGFMIGFAVYSTQSKTELVASDYYDQEIQYQQVIDGKNRMAQMNSSLEVVISAETIQVNLPAELHNADSGHVRFYRPSNEIFDYRVEWDAFEQGQLRIPADKFVSGPYQLVLQAYIDGELYFHEERITIE
jgi:nitrogen fixation protein FixH